MSNIKFTSDTHWHHKAILKMCNRPFKSPEEMDETMIQEWNKVVKPEDTVYHLGDFAYKTQVSKIANLLQRLNGTIHLIKGNHDGVVIQAYKQLSNSWGTKTKNFASIKDYTEVYVGDQMICLFHYPMRSWHWNYRGVWHLFGHEHGNYAPHFKSVDVGVDNIQNIVPGATFRPLDFEEIKAFMEKQPRGTHHEIPADKLKAFTGDCNNDTRNQIEESKEV